MPGYEKFEVWKAKETLLEGPRADRFSDCSYVERPKSLGTRRRLVAVPSPVLDR